MSGRKSVSGGHVKALLFWEVRPQLGSHSLGRLRGTAQHQKKDVLFIIEDWNAKVGSQEIPGVTGKFGLGGQNEAGQRLTEFWKRTCWPQQTPSSNNTREDSTHGHHQMVNTEVRLITFFAAKDADVQSAKTRLGADCGSDHELLIAKF